MEARERATVRIQAKGRLTVPAELRRRIGLNPGDEVVVEETARGLLVMPVMPHLHQPETVLSEPVVPGSPMVSRDRPMGDYFTGERMESPRILDMRKLGDLLRSKLREAAAVSATSAGG